MRVHLPSIVFWGGVDERLVDVSDYLDVVGCTHVLDTLEGTAGDDSRTAAGFGAPRYGLSFCVTD